MLLRQLLTSARNHPWLVLTGIAACVVAAMLVSLGQPKLYEAAAVVRVLPINETRASQQYEASQRLARTYAEMYEQGAVNRTLRRQLPGRGPIDSEELVGAQVKDLGMLSVGALTGDPQRSVLIANRAWEALDRLDDDDRLILVTPAVLPEGPAVPNLWLNGTLAAVAGLLISVALVFLLDMAQQRIPGDNRLARDFGQPVLATIPHLSSSGPAARGKATTGAIPPSSRSGSRPTGTGASA